MWRFKKSHIDFETGTLTLDYLDEDGNTHCLISDVKSKSTDWSDDTIQNINPHEAQFLIDGLADIYLNRQ